VDTEKTRRLWAAFSPRKRLGVDGEQLTQLLRVTSDAAAVSEELASQSARVISSLSEELSKFTEELERWQRERLLPLIEAFASHRNKKGPPPKLPAIDADDPLVLRLLRAKGLDPAMKQTIITQAARWEHHESTSALRKRGLWPALIEELSGDTFWQRYSITSYRATYGEAELEALAAFYESPAGQKFNTIMARWNEANQSFLAGDVCKAKFTEWIELLAS